jgi:hypothetical protein
MHNSLIIGCESQFRHGFTFPNALFQS